MPRVEGKKELGRIEEIFAYLVHIEADPIQKGLFIKELKEKYGLSLKEISKRTGWSLPRVSELYKAVTSLIPPLLERTHKGEIKASTALELAKLPPEEQEKFVDKEKILLREVKEARRRLAFEGSLEELVNQPLEIPRLPEEEVIEVVCPYCGKKITIPLSKARAKLRARA